MIYRNYFFIGFFSLLFVFLSSSCEKSTKSVYIVTSKVYSEFNGTKELERKLQSIQQKQKYILDSLRLEINTFEKLSSSKAALDKLNRKKEIYTQLLRDFSQSNEGQLKEYSEGIWKQINQYIGEYGKENKIAFIHGANGSGSLMYADSTMDVTDKVILFINNKYAGN